MILEHAVLDVKEGQQAEFEQAFNKARQIISSQPGYISHELLRCTEKHNRYLLLVKWQTLEDHVHKFRRSEQYLKWKNLLHHYYDPFPEVFHYQSKSELGR